MIKHENKNIQNAILAELFKAKRSIRIAVAWFTNDFLFQPLLLKLQTGVQVEIITNKDEINCSSNNEVDFNAFVATGGILYWNETQQLLHHKFCIIDDNVVIEGSYNWTNKAEYNEESVSISKDINETTDFYLSIFENLKRLYSDSMVVERSDQYRTFPPYLNLFFYKVITRLADNRYAAKIDRDGLYAILNGDMSPRTDFFFSEFYIPDNHFKETLIYPISDDIIWVKCLGKWGLYNYEINSMIVKPEYDHVEYCGIGSSHISADSYHAFVSNRNSSNYHFLVKKDGKYGIIRRDGGVLYDCEYDELILHYYLEQTSLYNRWVFIIARQGNEFTLWIYDHKVSELSYDSITQCPGKESFIAVKDGKYSLFSLGNLVLKDYDLIEPLDNLFYKVRRNNQMYVFSDFYNTWLLCDNIETIRFGCFQFQYNGKSGVVHGSRIIIECKYNEIIQTEQGYFIVKSEYGCGLLDESGKTLLEPGFERIESANRHILIVEQKGLQGLYNMKRREFWAECVFDSIEFYGGLFILNSVNGYSIRSYSFSDRRYIHIPKVRYWELVVKGTVIKNGDKTITPLFSKNVKGQWTVDYMDGYVHKSPGKWFSSLDEAKDYIIKL